MQQYQVYCLSLRNEANCIVCVVYSVCGRAHCNVFAWIHSTYWMQSAQETLEMDHSDDIETDDPFKLGQYYFNHGDVPQDHMTLQKRRSTFCKPIAGDLKRNRLQWHQVSRIDFILGELCVCHKQGVKRTGSRICRSSRCDRKEYRFGRGEIGWRRFMHRCRSRETLNTDDHFKDADAVVFNLHMESGSPNYIADGVLVHNTK